MNTESQTVLKYEAEVGPDGQIEIKVPFKPGSRLLVIVLEEPSDTFADLATAAQDNLDFWDNSYDDEDWNNA